MADYNIYTIPEEYRPTWDATLLAAITQPAVHLEQFSKRLANCTGEYIKFQSRGTTTIGRRKQRHEKIVWDELLLGQRRIYPVSFAKALGLSKDDEIFKGGLPITLQTLHDALTEAAAPQVDRVFLGVEYDDNKNNCVIAAAGTEHSPYKNDGSDGVNTVVHSGHFGGIMNTMFAGQDGTTQIALPQQPMINGSLAANYAAYSASLDGLGLKDTNVIPVNYAKDGTPVDSGLTIEKLRAARMSMVLRHAVSANETICMAITPWQMDNLLSLEKLQNADYGFQTLKTGELNTFLGIKFLVTVDVPIVNIGTTDAPKWVRACPMWVQRDVGFGIWKNVEYDITNLPDYWDTVIAKLQFSYGAGRLREESMMTVHCAESELAGIA